MQLSSLKSNKIFSYAFSIGRNGNIIRISIDKNTRRNQWSKFSTRRHRSRQEINLNSETFNQELLKPLHSICYLIINITSRKIKGTLSWWDWCRFTRQLREGSNPIYRIDCLIRSILRSIRLKRNYSSKLQSLELGPQSLDTIQWQTMVVSSLLLEVLLLVISSHVFFIIIKLP